ncbi:MAG: oligosaccharide flippase family protein [Crocinitomicaceae bacterium]|nr:oligosaccharide flippase family protein [Crocinitomicaceae bacterium]
MGIIQRQALRNTVINFIGAIFGSITRISMSLLITEAQIGLLTLLDAISGVFSIVFSFGFEQILAKMFPRFRDDKNGHHGFLMFGVLLSLTGILVSSVLFFFFEDLFLSDNEGTNKIFRSFSFLVFPLIFFRIVFRNLDGYAKMLFNTVIGVFLESFLSKMVLAMGMVAFFLSWIDFDQLVYVFVLNFCIPGLVIIFYAFLKTKKITLPHKDLIAREERKNIGEYILFGILLGTSGSIILYIDSLMVNKMVSMEALGVYSILFFAARLLVIPAKAINRISTVIIAESWNNKDIDNIQSVYEKSCLNQLLIGAFMFGVGWACLEPVLSLSPNLIGYAEHSFIFFFLGLGLVVEMATGVNTSIIATSTKFKWNTYFGFALAICVVLFNLIFITLYNVEGAALASMSAMILINFLRWLFIYKSFKLQPFNRRFFVAVLLSVAFILLCHFIDFDWSAVQKIVIYGAGLTILFWGIIIATGLSPDINQWLKKMKDTYLTKSNNREDKGE